VTEVFIGRQPIFDTQVQIVGYELLYRSATMNKAEFADGNHATSAVISNAFLEIGLEKLVGDKWAFINLTRKFLLGELPIPLHHDQLVLEVLEDITLDEEVLNALKKLKKQGYKLAMDDVVDPADIMGSFGLAHFVKVDLMKVDRSCLPGHMKIYKKYGLKTLAEKVETKEEFDWCLSLGFDYFQGYFLCKPNVIKEKKISGARMSIMRLLAELQTPSTEFGQIDLIIRQDVSLSYKLLRLINSAYYARASEIKSIKQALTLLGLNQIRAWVSLLLLSETDNKPPALIITAMVRAKMAELLVDKNPRIKGEEAFTVGLFSVLDALLDLPFEEVFKQIPLSPLITQALIEKKGELGKLLNIVLAQEQGDWDSLESEMLDRDQIQTSYLQAVAWADEVQKVLMN